VFHAPSPANAVNSLRCVQVIAGVLGRAGEAGRKQRLALAEQKKYNFQPTPGLETPGHLKNTTKKYPTVIQLGGTIQELEEQDRGIQYDYRLDENLDDEGGDGLDAKANQEGGNEDLRGYEDLEDLGKDDLGKD
jgi:hypothetical protein